MAHHVIYIPGLGDSKTFGQDKAIKFWRIFGIAPHYLALGWEDKSGFDAKMEKLDGKVTDLLRSGHKVSLVGVSAAASAAVNYYVSNPALQAIVLIAGKVHNANQVHTLRYKMNPDFKTSMEKATASIKFIQSKGMAKNILSIYSEHDRVVPPKDSRIKGATHLQIFAWSHSSTIFLGIMLYGSTISRFIRAH